MELDNRLQILKDAGQLSQKNFDALKRVINIFNSKWGIKLTEENGSMFITHLSVAAQRIEKGEVVEKLDKNIYQEVLDSKSLNKCHEAIKDIEKEIAMVIPENEKDFLMVYLCMLFENNQ